MSTAGAPARTFTMSELVERTGVAAATVRYYLNAGLLPPPLKAAANRYLYDERHVELIRLVRLLRERRALSIEAIGRLLPEMLPDLLGRPVGGVFRQEMWGELLAGRTGEAREPSVAERLLESGLVLFSRHGYAEVSIDDVCRAAGIAKGSFYRHYSSKEELFFDVVEATGTRAAAELAQRSGDELLPVERAVALLSLALGPHLVIAVDLASLATQRRPGHGAALRRLLGALRASVGERLLDGDATSEEVLDRALVAAVRRAVDEHLGATSAAPERAPIGS